MIGESLVSSFEVALYRYGWYILAIFGILIMLGGGFLFTQATGDTFLDRFENVRDVITGFFGTIIDSVQNGFQNMVDAITGLIPSVNDIWDSIKHRVDAMIPDLSSVYNYIDNQIDDALSSVYNYIDNQIDDALNSLSGIKDTIQDTVEEVVDDYLIGEVFEPLCNWIGYDWDYSSGIPMNLYGAGQQFVYYVITHTPGLDWIVENAQKIEDYLEDYI
jgi:phage-related protein